MIERAASAAAVLLEADPAGRTGPTPAEFQPWLMNGGATESAKRDSCALLDDLHEKLVAVAMANAHDPEYFREVFTLRGAMYAAAFITPTNDVPTLSVAVETIHQAWLTVPPMQRPTHPMTPLVQSWIDRPRRATWDERQYVNLPAPYANTLITRPSDTAAHLPADYAIANPDPAPDKPRFEVGYLPTLEPPDSILPLNLLNLFGPVASRGAGGPVAIPARIGWEVMVALSDKDRNGQSAILPTTLGRLHELAYPSTPRFQTAKGIILINGLRQLDAARLRWRARADSTSAQPMIEVWDMPTTPDPAGLVTFASQVPAEGVRGPQIDRLLLRELAAKSYRAHRAMLAAYVLFDRYATVNGRLVSHTLPEVKREPGTGYILDARGRLAVERGAPTRRATHPKAVQTGGRVQHHDIDRYYPWIEGDDLILLAHGRISDTPAGKRKQRERARESLQRLAAGGYVSLETRYRSTRGGRELIAVRIMPSDDHGEAHRARWAARKHNRRASS